MMSSAQRPGSKTQAVVHTIADGRVKARSDYLATEEPLELRLGSGSEQQTLAITMRTPGADFELAAGFLHGEGVVARAADIRAMSYCVDPAVDADQRYNIVNVELAAGVEPDLRPLERHFFTSSACGVCGKAALESLHIRGCPVIAPGPSVAAELLYELPDRLRAAQGLFDSTGGLHAAALFDADGRLLALREDVGRHNALDKLLGWAVLNDHVPLHDHIVLVSGRASYELLQKSLAAGVPMVCAVSAPSSLAVSLAAEFGITLVGFLRGRRCNVYTGHDRVIAGHGAEQRAGAAVAPAPASG